MSDVGSAPADRVTERVALVGVGCRFPGRADSPDDFWELLLSGRDALGRIPEARWKAYESLGPDFAAALREAPRQGYYLDDISGFDAGFFGVTPREAELMDPQQRVLLHVAWDALENAGIPPTSLRGSDTGVFVGIGSDDYGRRLLEDLPSIEAWTGIGSSMCASANRLSYSLDLHGPSMAVDTACSSSLVSLHLACQSLRSQECSVALAAGVNLVVSPGLNLTLVSAGALAPDGRSKSFDASADGYGRGEGAGVLVLKRLTDALRDGDRVLATILGSSVSQDGRTDGIMAPDEDAQRALLRETCRLAGVRPESVDYVEAHGTGTRRGDPLELRAIASVYGEDRSPSDRCLIGSVKSNIGHLEAGAGVAGLIKTALSLHNRRLPATAHHTRGNPEFDWAASGLKVVTRNTPWAASDTPRRAAVSGFGYGGTIAHVILEEAPPAQDTKPMESSKGPRIYPLSARSAQTLATDARNLADHLASLPEGSDPSSIGRTLAVHRSHLEHRGAVIADGARELRENLLGLADGIPSTHGVTGQVLPGPGPVWVFSGHGSHWSGMGVELLKSEPAFREVVECVEPIFSAELGHSPTRLLGEGGFEPVHLAQPMTFVMHVGLAAVWRHYGVEPAAVVGHSVGEIAAAVVSGALTLTEGAALICRRSLLLERVAGRGAMAMVDLPFDVVQERLSGRADLVAAIAASPLSTVVSGDPHAVEAAEREWATTGSVVRRVASDVAFHSPHMDPLLDELRGAAHDLSPREPRTRVYSTAYGDPRRSPSFDGAYWATNLREPVRLASAVRAAADDGFRTFIEVSAHPVVTHSISETLTEHGVEDGFAGITLRRNRPQRTTFLVSVATAHCHGVEVDWERLQPNGHLTDVPARSWRMDPHWRETSSGTRQEVGHDIEAHTLLGTRVEVAGSSLDLWRTVLDDPTRPYPGRHHVNGAEIAPAALLLTTFLEAAHGRTGVTGGLLDVELRVPLWVEGPREVQVVREGTALRVASRPASGEGSWLVNASSTAGPARAANDRAAEPPVLEPAAPESVQEYLTSVGVPEMAFEWTIDELLRAEGRARARVRAAPRGRGRGTWAPLLDAALSIAPTVFPGAPELRMVSGVGALDLFGSPPETAHLRIDPVDEDHIDIGIHDGNGVLRARLDRVRYLAGGRERLTATDAVHEVTWVPRPPADEAGQPADSERRRLVILADPDDPKALALRAGLTARGRLCETAATVADLVGLDGFTDVLYFPSPTSVDEPVAQAADRNTWTLLEAARHLSSLDLLRFPRLWCLTTGVRECSEEDHLAQAPLWGTGRVIAEEHSELWGGIIDLPPTTGDDLARDVDELLHNAPHGEVFSLREGAVRMARLRRTERTSDGPGMECRPDSTYLITGGLGSLGLRIAHHLADHGARRLVLTGREGLPPRARWDRTDDPRTLEGIHGVKGLERRGVTVTVLALDVADEAAAEAFSPQNLGLPAIRGIVHAAGVLDDKLVTSMDEDSLRRVTRPKIAGSWTLHRLFPRGTVDFLVMFSSCGYLLGLPGQASYGAGNAFLDGLTAHRNGSGSGSPDTFSIGWTSWRSQGMADNAAVSSELDVRGVSDISPDEAFDAWNLTMRGGPRHVVVLGPAGNAGESADRPTILDGTFHTVENTATAPDHSRGLEHLSGEELRESVLQGVVEQISEAMKLPPSSLNTHRSLAEQGLDSVMTIAIRRKLEKRFGHNLPAALLWQQPTVTGITDHMCSLITVGS